MLQRKFKSFRGPADILKAIVQSLHRVKPSVPVLLSALKASTSSSDIENGRRVHADAVKYGKDSDIFVASSLVNMYAKCGNVAEAREIFDAMESRNAVSWTSLILGYADNGEYETGLELFRRMQHESSQQADAQTFVAALKACTGSAAKKKPLEVGGRRVKLGTLEQGMAIHSQASRSGCEDVFVSSILVDMYANCGSMLDARLIFDRMPSHDVVVWNALLLGYAENGEPQVTLELFTRLRGGDRGCGPNARTFVAAFQACGSIADQSGDKMVALEEGMGLHSQAARFQHCVTDIFVNNTLVDLYARCGSLLDSRRVFDRMRCHNVVSWNALMLGHADNGEEELALDLFERLREQSLAPDSRSFVAALRACSGLAEKESSRQVDTNSIIKAEALERGTRVHGEARDAGLDTDIYVTNALLDVYAKCGSLGDARRVFDAMQQRDAVSWTVLMLAYAENGDGHLALELHEQMQRQGCVRDARSFVAALKACASIAEKEQGQGVGNRLVKVKSLELGMALHSQAAGVSSCNSDVFLANTLVDLYSRCGSVLDARRAFDAMERHSTASWNALVLGLAENGEDELALDLFRCMGGAVEPDSRSFIAALRGVANLAERERGKQAETGLVKVESLRRVMEIEATSKLGDITALDAFLASALVDSYANCGSLEDARRVASKMEPRHSIAALNALVSGYAENGESRLAVELYRWMRESYPELLDARTMLAGLKACGSLAALETVREIHAEISRAGVLSSSSSSSSRSPSSSSDGGALATSLIDAYGRCGSVLEAQRLFDAMSPSPDTATWNSLMAGYSHHGDTKRALALLEAMEREGASVDGITLVSVLSACSHAGAVEVARGLLEGMASRFGVEAGVEHYHCVVDALGRANRVEEAARLARSMPFEASAVTWRTVLGACHKWENTSVGEAAFESLQGCLSWSF
ncbi:pentatricopeptide repeat-containing protein At4g39530-like [Selaginella moellendorffii]|uniref:pentatricopeptide repeat-containing protein At4g39530-like n=2 Tax=Selaginella moellendorffii TaxID=88036 RepID=UPI000D1CD63A|nr:pentatricopeptide repeat-containing protein At4g39530-like [Selaginella moellendorffii]XP_024521915.1 pentatricopeptide repeat-containing protein At4g39530-like [Selaginella moellendorffii]|eukprot:XP_024521909.1 pentatricopeptide repeat-containing protein At4g39530-like [Selaginella moellendorffii]